MNVETTLKKINKDRDKIEACFVFCCFKEPDILEGYLAVNEGGDKTLRNKDAKYYFSLAKAMYQQGFRTFDHVSVETFLENKPEARKRYEEYGGYREIEQLMSIVDASNVDVYFDKIVKMNHLNNLIEKYEDVFSDVSKFDDLSDEDVYTLFESINSNASINSGSSERIESLALDDHFINRLDSGENIGFSYNKTFPILNYITLGAAPGSLYLVGAHSGQGKSSMVFGGLVLGLHANNIKTAIISNEMLSDTYKVLLLEHILTKDLDYWDLTRKKLKLGHYTPEQRQMVERAMQISKEKYSDIQFVKMFDNNIGKVMKYLRKLKAQGVSVVVYDTFKSDDGATEANLWQSLMLDARKLFQCCSKLGICCITTYQLALHTENQRYLSASCLSNSKQIKEVYETMVYMRTLWEDEYPGERYDVKPYKFNKDNKRIKEPITLDPNEKYLLLFVDKTRADEDKQVIICRWRARFNEWKELGYATVINDHKQPV